MKKKDFLKVLLLLEKSRKAKRIERDSYTIFKTETGILIFIFDDCLKIKMGKTVFTCKEKDISYFFNSSKQMAVLLIKNDKVVSKLYLTRTDSE